MAITKRDRDRIISHGFSAKAKTTPMLEQADPVHPTTALAEARSAQRATRGAAPQAAPELSIVVPVFKEVANVPILVERLTRVLDGLAWEVIFVDDDSPDGTTEAARKIARTDPRVRCIRRIGRRGLAGACIEGMLASSARPSP